MERNPAFLQDEVRLRKNRCMLAVNLLEILFISLFGKENVFCRRTMHTPTGGSGVEIRTEGRSFRPL